MSNAYESEKALRVIDRLEAEVATLRKAQSEPIAIVGMSLRFPGADDPEAFWARLHRGEEATREVPVERWSVDALYSANPDTPGKMSTRYGGFLDGIDRFDAAFFNIAPREAMVMDPQQRLLLELSWQALEDAGLSPDELYGSPSGVFVGVCASDYFRMALNNVDNVTAYLGTGNATSVAAGRLSYTFGFTGPCLSLDTACSSALVAVHHAAESLRKGDCRIALAASVNLILAPEVTVAFSRARMMAPDGRCKTFDERADGYVRSEGAAVLVLKTLSAARADGDRILAVIRGTAINQDGASGGLTVPNGPAQSALVRQALARAGVQPSDVDYIEAHGTGTALGDPIEVGALAEVFGRGRDAARPLLLGSVKTLVGHLEVAAGMAGLIKVILALEHETVPGYPQLQELSSRIPWQRYPFVVPRESVAWPRGRRRRIAGVSAFGFSGTNAHAVVEEAPAPTARPAAAPQPAHLVCLSARTPDALAELARRHADHLAAHHDAALDEIAWTANTGRARFSQRLAVVAESPGGLRDRLAAFAQTVHQGVAPATEGSIAFLFSGQGSQYAGMGKELYDLHPEFRAVIDRCEAILEAHVDRPLRALMWGEHGALLGRTRYTQPVLFALEVALATLWQAWGVRPSYVMGHSVGELAAACVAGVFGLEDGLALVAARGRLMDELPEDGAMAVVAAGHDVVEPVVVRCRDRLSIAGLNAPDQTVISGDRAAVREACERLQAEHGVGNRGLLDVSHAFHSPLMRPILEPLRAVAGAIAYRRADIEIISNVTGASAGDAMTTAAYWVDHVLAPVDFMAGVRALDAAGVTTLLEIGPGATLIGLARACVGVDRFAAAASLKARVPAWSQMLDGLATLFTRGVAADFRRAGRCDQPPPPRRSLPTYPFQRQRHWVHAADGSTRTVAIADTRERHPLLGRRLRSAALASGDFQFEAAIAPDRPAYLGHHRVYDKVVVPAAAYLEMALAAIHRELPEAAAVVRNVAVQAALVLRPDVETVVQTHLADAGGNRYRFKIFSAAAEDAAWQLHVAGEIEVAPAGEAAPVTAADDVAARFAAAERVDLDAFYARYAALGLGCSGAFRSVVELRRIAGDGARSPEVLARIAPAGAASDRSHVLHPAALDGCFHAVGAMVAGDVATVYLPVGIEAVRVLGPVPAALWAHAILRNAPTPGDPRVIADLRLIDDDGRVVCVIDGLHAVPADRRALAHVAATWKDKLYALGWIPQPLPDASAEAADARRWLVLGDSGGAGARLHQLLESRGQTCTLVTAADVDPLDRVSWARMLADLAAASDRPLAGIVHLWSVDAAPEEIDPAPEAAIARSCGSTLALVQSLVGTPNQRLPRLWLVTRGAQAVADGDRTSATHAALWGLGRTIALEHPSLGCTCVDLDPRFDPDPQDDIGDALAAELLHPDGELQIAHRAGKRHAARLTRASTQAAHQLTIPGDSIGKVVLRLPAKVRGAGALRADRSYWITGGLGALGLHVARSLVERGARRLVLSGRSGPDAAACQAIDALRAAGADVVVERADVSDPAQVAAVVERIARDGTPLGGIVHAAGVLDDGVIAKQTWPRFAAVLAPKVAGAWNLHQATRALPLDFFVMFSSIAALLGAPGQASYAAANAFLDGLAAWRRSQGLPATSIEWGPWAAGGMAERARAANRARFASFGLARMAAGDCLEVLEHILNQPRATVAVAEVDWAKHAKMVTNPGVARFYAQLATARPDQQEAGALASRLAREPDGERAGVLLDFLRGQIASVVGLAAPEAIDATRPLLDIGFDSLMAVELKSRVEASLGCTLSPTLLFDHPTLEQLGRHLLVNVLHLGAGDGPPPAAPAQDAAEAAGDAEDLGAVAPLATLRESVLTASDGARLCVCSWGSGDGPLVICMHGILDQAAIWDEVAAGLVDRGHRVQAVDLRGHGRSAHPPAGAAITVLDFVRDLGALAAQTPRPFILIGHSMGASAAALFASAHPVRVSHLVLVEPVVPDWRAQHGARDLLMNELRYLTEAPAHAVYPDLTTAARMLTLSHPGLATLRALALAQRMTEPCDGGFRWVWDGRLRNPLGVDLCLSRAQYLDLLGGLEVPSTWIYGTTSQFAGTPVLVPPDAALPRSQHVTIAGGHNLHTENAAALLDEILTGIEAGARSPRQARRRSS